MDVHIAIATTAKTKRMYEDVVVVVVDSVEERGAMQTTASVIHNNCWWADGVGADERTTL